MEFEKNLANLDLICDRIDAAAFPELVLPTAFLEWNGCRVGYLMPYISGVCLDSALRDRRIERDAKVEWFNAIAAVILALPPCVHLGDLHGHNVLIDRQNQIHLIDIDGFSVDDGFTLICPMFYNKGMCRDLPEEKYFDEEGHVRVSMNTDIFCLFSLFLRHILDGYDPFSFSPVWLGRFFDFLETAGISAYTVEMFRQVLREEDNYLVPAPFEDFKRLKITISYKSFLRTTGLIEEERRAEVYLLRQTGQGG